ncbi:MAG: FliA/WhiG family RNA polymerase sigma factor [Oscillospiraceae bacterium]|nr:FliA/WhiG family RNA polymerase sigma factor [Oscillospiraceae bacterium]
MDKAKQELFRKYKQTGSLEVRNELVLLYMDIVRGCVFSLKGNSDAEDLVNEGVIGLIAAVETFDADRGVKFETYANLKIKGAIIDYIRRQDRVPRLVRRFGKELDAAYGVLYNQLGRQPNDIEIAKYMNLTPTQFSKRLADTVGVNTLSFEELLYEDNINSMSFSDSFDDSVGSRLYSNERKQVIIEAVASLKPKEQQVISLYYYENLKLREIAEVLGLSESRVCQIHSKCMLVLKSKLESYISEI